jgi:hypothetical protein
MVTKDLAEFNNFHPMTQKLVDREHNVLIIAEGLSLPKWHDTP